MNPDIFLNPNKPSAPLHRFAYIDTSFVLFSLDSTALLALKLHPAIFLFPHAPSISDKVHTRWLFQAHTCIHSEAHTCTHTYIIASNLRLSGLLIVHAASRRGNGTEIPVPAQDLYWCHTVMSRSSQLAARGWLGRRGAARRGQPDPELSWEDLVSNIIRVFLPPYRPVCCNIY